LKSDRVLISEQITRAKGLPGTQADRVMHNSGLSDENIAFVRSITGEKINQWVSRAKGFGESLSSEDAELTHVRGKGRWVTFLEDNPLPQLLIRRGQFNGRLQLASSNMSVAGTPSDIAYPLEEYSQPATAVVIAKDNRNASLLLKVTLDHRTADFNDSFNLEIMNLPFNEMSLSSGSEKNLILKTSTLNFTTIGSALKSTVIANVVAKLSDPKLQANLARAAKSEQWIAETLNLLDSVDLQVDISGTLKDPMVDITSNLDKILAAGLKSQMSTQADKFKQQFTDKLGQQTSGQLADLSAKEDFLKDIQALLNE